MAQFAALSFALLTLFGSTSAWAATSASSKAIIKQIEALESLAYSSNVIDVEGDTPYEMIESLREQLIGDDSISITMNSVPDFVDELNIGTMSNELAQGLVVSAMDEMDYSDQPFTSGQREDVRSAFKALAKTNAIYAWNPFGAAGCGSSFSTVIIIDPETKTAYELIFVNFEGC